jgi:hypothetical protein
MKNYKGEEIKRSWGIAAAGAALVAGALLFSGCANQTVRDLEGVPVQEPEKIELYLAPDQFPNIIAMCVHGAGFATTTRQANGVVTRVEAWDAWCADTAS